MIRSVVGRVVLSLVVVVMAGCYAHSPTKVPRQLESGEAVVSGQVRMPGYWIFPALSAVGQYGLGAGDVGVQAGYPSGFAGLFGRVYPTSHTMVGLEATYHHVPRDYNQEYVDLVIPDYDHNFTAGMNVLATGQTGAWSGAAGLKSQAVFWIPDGARSRYPDLDPRYRRTRLAGFAAGPTAGVEYRFGEHLAIQGEAFVLPVGVETFHGDWEQRYEFGRESEHPVVRDGDPLQENRWQATIGLSFSM